MKIQLHEISIRDLVNSFVDNDEEGVVGYHGQLDIRPKYQREFIYNSKEKKAVIESINNGFPLNVMYWVDNGEEYEDSNKYEVLDGQQRIISICQYHQNEFGINYQYFDNLTKEEQDKFLDYKLMVYFCSGTDREKLDWFRTINIAGLQLTEQELRNAIYCGSWVTDAKRHFSRIGCPASDSDEYLKGSSTRQHFLETAIQWINAEKGIKEIEEYMSVHQHDENANELWLHFQKVINWTETIFPNYRKEMKGLNWGLYFAKYGQENHKDYEPRIRELMMDDEVKKKSGIYLYLLSGEEKHLNLRSFSDSMKRSVFESQNGICSICEEEFDIDDMEADHIKPWNEGGKTEIDNCQMLCRDCNRTKSDN